MSTAADGPTDGPHKATFSISALLVSFMPSPASFMHQIRHNRKQGKKQASMTMNILITGASGYLGQHLISALCLCADSKYKICAAYGTLSTFEDDVVSSSQISSSHSSLTLLPNLDLTSRETISNTIKSHGPFDAVVHLAAISSPGVCEKEPDQAKAVNVPSALLEALPSTTDIIFLSTDQVYDGSNAPYVETDEAKPVNLYGQTKLEFERLLMDKCPTNAVALRSSLIIGTETPFQCRKQTFLQFVHDRLQKQEETSFFTDEFRNVVYVGDICRVIRHFIDNGIGERAAGVYNMGGADRVSRLDFAEAVAKHCGLETTCAKGVARSSLPPGPVASPPDISMDSSKLEQATGIKMLGLADIIKHCLS